MNFPLRQIDVSNAFLYADVDAEIYVEYPHTYPTNLPSVCKLKKSLYGIKQAPQLWQQHLNKKLIEVGFRQLPHDLGMYRLDDEGSYALLVAYVDDILYVSSSVSLGDRIEDLKKSLDLTVSTKVTQFLGLNISRTSSAIHLTASKYAESLAKRFKISTDFVATPYRSTPTGHILNNTKLLAAGLHLYQQQLGCLLFAAVTCRPDLADRSAVEGANPSAGSVVLSVSCHSRGASSSRVSSPSSSSFSAACASVSSSSASSSSASSARVSSSSSSSASVSSSRVCSSSATNTTNPDSSSTSSMSTSWTSSSSSSGTSNSSSNSSTSKTSSSSTSSPSASSSRASSSCSSTPKACALSKPLLR
ncbi:unnamed protein product [Closterium sp. NIES-53]